MAGIQTTNGAIILAVRAHHNEQGGNPNEATEEERRAQNVMVMESARLYGGGCMSIAAKVYDELQSLTNAQFWAYRFMLHPTLMQFVHHRLM